MGTININQRKEIENFANEYINGKFIGFQSSIKSQAKEYIYMCFDDENGFAEMSHIANNRTSFDVFNKMFLSKFVEYLCTVKKEYKMAELIAKNIDVRSTNINLEEVIEVSNSDIPPHVKYVYSQLADKFKEYYKELKTSDNFLKLSNEDKKRAFDNKNKKQHYDAYKEEMDRIDSSNKYKIDAYDYTKALNNLLAEMNIFQITSASEDEKKIVSNKYDSLLNRCNATSNLTFNQNKNLSFLKTQSESFLANEDSSIQYMEVSRAYKELTKTYEEVIENRFLKSYYLATGILKDDKIIPPTIKKNHNKLIDGFFHKDIQKISNTETEENPNNPFTYFMEKSKFMFLKELDYKNLEAMLLRKPLMVSQESCDKLFLTLYFTLMLSARANSSYTGDDKPKNSSDKIAKLFKNIKDRDWKSDMGDFEKHFSTAYSFTKYENNPFTEIMGDEGHNVSQEYSKRLREEVENNAKEVIETVKNVFYKSYDGKSENGVYDIFQEIADIAYELSNPMTFKVKLSTGDEAANILNSFIDACSSAVEIQSSVLIYDFLFNFSIPVGGKQYTLNKLDNMIKMFNLINKSTNNSSNNLLQLDTKEEMVKDSSYYHEMKRFGFLAYNKEWNEMIKSDDSLLKKLTGYYLSDENIGYDEVEFLRHEGEVCDPGDVEEIRGRFAKTDYFHKLAMYAAHRLKSSPNTDIAGSINIRSKNGYLNIQKFYKELKYEAFNKDDTSSYLGVFLRSIFDEVDSDDSEFNSYVDELKNSIKRFRHNSNRNSVAIKRYYASKIIDDKVIDWYMKMLPTYKLIMKTFGLKDYIDDIGITSFIDKLIKFLDTLIRMVFDRWKTETSKKMEMRRIRLLDKERYYYFQAFPVLIDYMISTLEDSFTQCSKIYDGSSIDRNKVFENEKNNSLRENNLLTQLKMQLGYMSSSQKNKTRYMLKKVLIKECSIPSESAETITKSLIDNSDEYISILKSLPNSSNEKIVNYLEKYLNL